MSAFGLGPLRPAATEVAEGSTGRARLVPVRYTRCPKATSFPTEDHRHAPCLLRERAPKYTIEG